MTSIVPWTALETALAWVAQASWQAAVLGLLVFLVSLALRRWLEARWRFCLWLVVLARLALPVTPPAPWSLFRVVPLTFVVPATGRPVEDLVAEPIPTSYNRIATGAPGEEASELSPPQAPLEEHGEEEFDATPGTAGQWLAVAWLAGVLVLLARHARLHMRLGRHLRAGREVSDPIVQNAFRRCREELGIVRPVRLLTATDMVGPATCGAFRAIILFPERLFQLLSPDELRFVLLHELIHVRRWDVLLDRVAVLMVAVHWFNPIAWLTRACLRRERELRRGCSPPPGRAGIGSIRPGSVESRRTSASSGSAAGCGGSLCQGSVPGQENPHDRTLPEADGRRESTGRVATLRDGRIWLDGYRRRTCSQGRSG